MYSAQYYDLVRQGNILGMPKIRRQEELKAEQKVAITKFCYILGKLLDGNNCKILLDTGGNRSCVSKTFFKLFIITFFI